MLSATGTAYPVLKPNPSDRELNDIFTPTLCFTPAGQYGVR
jgi:hypothetical protein